MESGYSLITDFTASFTLLDQYNGDNGFKVFLQLESDKSAKSWIKTRIGEKRHDLVTLELAEKRLEKTECSS